MKIGDIVTHKLSRERLIMIAEYWDEQYIDCRRFITGTDETPSHYEIVKHIHKEELEEEQ